MCRELEQKNRLEIWLFDTLHYGCAATTALVSHSPRCLSISRTAATTNSAQLNFILLYEGVFFGRAHSDSARRQRAHGAAFAGARKMVENVLYIMLDGKLLGQWNNYHKHQNTNRERRKVLMSFSSGRRCTSAEGLSGRRWTLNSSHTTSRPWSW